MTQAPFHTQETFERAIGTLIDEADSRERGDDLDRLVQHALARPDGVSGLAAFLFLMDEGFRAPLQREIDAYRRWRRKKDLPAEDQDIFDVLAAVYKKKREG